MIIESWQPGVTLDDMERSTIMRALRFYQGSRTRTAISLGIALRTLTNKISAYKKMGMEVPDSQVIEDLEEKSKPARPTADHRTSAP